MLAAQVSKQIAGASTALVRSRSDTICEPTTQAADVSPVTPGQMGGLLCTGAVRNNAHGDCHAARTLDAFEYKSMWTLLAQRRHYGRLE